MTTLSGLLVAFIGAGLGFLHISGLPINLPMGDPSVPFHLALFLAWSGAMFGGFVSAILANGR